MKYFKIFFLFLSILSYSQDYKILWSDAIQNELDGKTETAYKKVQAIYDLAKQNKNDEQIIKCFFYISKFRQVFEEKAQENIISNIREEIVNAKPASKAILHYLYGTILSEYYNYNSYAIRTRTPIENNKSIDFLTWTAQDFKKEINIAFTEALKEQKLLYATPITNYSEILEIPSYVDGETYTLYDLLFKEITKQYEILVRNLYGNNNQKPSEKEIESFYTDTDTFLNLKTEHFESTLKSFISVLQQREMYSKNNFPEKTDVFQFERLKVINSTYFSHTTYKTAIDRLENTTSNQYLKYKLLLNRLKDIADSDYSSSEKNQKSEALQSLEEIIKTNLDEYQTTEAQMLKEKILAKQLEIKHTQISYEGENTRAWIQFKNIDSLKISYYKISAKEFIENNYKFNYGKKATIDSILTPKKLIKQTFIKIPNQKDYLIHSTEILLQKLPLGNYIIVFEDPDTKSNSKIEKNYSFYTVSNISYVEDDNSKSDLIYSLDRKTGAPLQNAYVSAENKKSKANAIGKITFPKTSNDIKIGFSESYLVNEKDTLIIKKLPTKKYKYDKDEDENFEAKAMLYFDRAIYRPGQKVFFKGIIIQNKNNVKSVASNLTVHLTIDNASYETVKEMDIQTNEFGSFSGEFDIPKNCMTGEFTFEIEEPSDDKILKKDTKYYNEKEDEHTFWENVNFNNQEFTFKVEEYKRPTFEITFDKIKEAYSLGDKLFVKGYAKTLAGSNLTHATVKYSVSKSPNYGTISNATKNNLEKETTTNEKGEFTIPIETLSEDLKTQDINEINFTITVAITDINGETRSSEHSILVKKQTLKLISYINNNTLFAEDDNKISIETTNLDNSFIPAKGKIEVYKIHKQSYLKRRKLDTPDIPGFSEEEFKSLFPYEDNEKNHSEKIILETLVFNTQNSKEIKLPKLEKGSYEIQLSAIDTKNNTIEVTKHITIKSKINPLTDDEVFSFKRINNDDSENIHFELLTNLPKLYVTTRFYKGKNLTEEKVSSLQNGKAIISFKKDKNTNQDISFHFSTQWENDGYSKNITFPIETLNKKINFEVASFRNKIEPGSQESWSFKIKDNKLETEVLASMYDTSLDQFTQKNWKEISFYTGNRPHYPTVDYRNNYNELLFTTKSQNIFYKKLTFEPKFEWFGFSFANPKNSYQQTKYKQKVAQNQIISLGSKLITGIVTDGSAPIPGATIVIKGESKGTSTGFDGKYAIHAKPGDVLEYSFMGMKTISKTVGNSDIINTILLDKPKQLAEVAITGLGIKKEKGTFNPNIIVVTSNDKDLTYFFKYRKQLFHNWEDDDEGIVKKKSSLSYSVRTVEESVVIRGNTSITSNNKALLIIDGEISENLNFSQISENDIASITVLKDAAATALYGSRAVNGVIVITTKTALKELSQVKTRTNFNETAFFYPHLKTDSSGKISFQFTTPESLTRWKLRLFGHDKESNMGSFETEIISQKDLMIMPNMPRFVRETDTLSITAKVVNLTKEIKSGTALLQLFDATTGKPIDEICANANNAKLFNCNAKENTNVSWSITIPEGIQGIQYKIVAKSGNFSDGEENILPVLPNKILVTESLPIWVREKSKKEFVFDRLKNNTSTTLKNQSYTFEYTSNPTWLAIQSLPYLLEYEHECAEQTFARFYANTLASTIINSQPKIAEVLEKWRKEPQQKSKLEMNEELKSIALRETPWLLDANEKERNQRIASLFELEKLTASSKTTFDKLAEKQNASGGFPWFSGGNDNYYITQHIVSGLGHLQKLVPSTNITGIVNKALPYLDTNFISNTAKQRKEKSNITLQEVQYLYCRSFYTKTHPIQAELQTAINFQIQQTKSDWLKYGLSQKAMLALASYRLGDSIFAKKIITHLKETAVKNSEEGMYWISNTKGSSWFDAPIENQALLIEAFNELDNDPKIINDLKAWLIRNKQKDNWGTTKATTEAIYALLAYGKNSIASKNENEFQIGDSKLLTQKLGDNKTENEAGYLKIQWKPEEINTKMATVSIENKNDVPSFGGVYWQYFENLEKITSTNNTDLHITKEVYKKIKDANGDKLISIKNNELQVGDKLTIRLVIKANHNFDFVHLKDLRASCLEPTNVLSEHHYKDSLQYYMSTKDTATHFFFDSLRQGTFVLEYDVIINNNGAFNNGIATIQSMYAPEFSAHSGSVKVRVTTK